MFHPKPLKRLGGRTRTRTWDPLIKSQLLYQLSYAPRTRVGSCSKAFPTSPGRGKLRPRARALLPLALPGVLVLSNRGGPRARSWGLSRSTIRSHAKRPGRPRRRLCSDAHSYHYKCTALKLSTPQVHRIERYRVGPVLRRHCDTCHRLIGPFRQIVCFCSHGQPLACVGDRARRGSRGCFDAQRR
jgi:hypothetical protein